ncbi:hypothetical protein MIR68_008843 [Amoeboaphelidium protococcarum]|nr:hypothetical protein MIR68_008843 [Amoeboaphelidium protococcarum]
MSIDQISKAVWQNDLKKLNDLLQQDNLEFYDQSRIDLNDWDSRGNSPLHLALMLGRIQAAQILIQNGSKANALNADNSSCLDEAICLGNRQLIAELWKRSWLEHLNDFRNDAILVSCLQSIADFDMEICVKLKSKIPVLAQVCPKETILVSKRRDMLQVQWTISKIKGARISRAKMSLIIRNRNGQTEAIIINHDAKQYSNLLPNVSTGVLHSGVDNFMSEGVVKNEFTFNDFVVEPILAANSGAQFQKKLKHGGWNTVRYTVSNLGCIQSQRSPADIEQEYEDCDNQCMNTLNADESVEQQQVQSLDLLAAISEDDLVADLDSRLSIESITTERADSNNSDAYVQEANEKIKAKLPSLMQKLKLKSEQFNVRRNETTDRRVAENLHPVHIKDLAIPQLEISEAEYFNQQQQQQDDLSQIGQTCSIGRRCIYRQQQYVKPHPVTVYMSKDFPMDIAQLRPLLYFILRDYCQSEKELNEFLGKFGEGFPVRIEVPINSILLMKASVTRFTQKNLPAVSNNMPPPDYKEGNILPIVEF